MVSSRAFLLSKFIKQGNERNDKQCKPNAVRQNSILYDFILLEPKTRKYKFLRLRSENRFEMWHHHFNSSHSFSATKYVWVF